MPFCDLLQNCTRREALLYISEIFNDEEQLKEVCEKNPAADLILLGFAYGNPKCMETLNRHLNVKELEDDINHVLNSIEIKKAKGDLV